MSRACQCKSHSGFTLLEVMVALAVFALAASLLILSDGNSVRQTRYQQEKVLAAQVADHYLNVLHAEERWSGPAVKPRIEDYGGYSWYVKETSEMANAQGLRKIQVDVYAGESPPEKSIAPLASLTTWRRRPE